MTLAPWRTHLSGALHQNRSLVYSRYFQLATVRQDGTPANRTVVFRGFQEKCDRLQIVTDDRSAKIVQIQHNTHAEACWYFPKTRDQFRLQGTLEIANFESADEELQAARRQVWENLSDNARSGFAWPRSGEVRSPSEAFEVDPPNPKTPLDSFCLLLLDPYCVDFLTLRGNPQNRWIYDRQPDGGWIEREVNP
ncbi:pyridoxamine 5'-phosphate oxidase family protein [Geitlerinema sp. CS-897]|nr:pyridoxamine 5'-phosphate oxidase family protein [Geitlerinema sp. CS-897]